MLNSKGNHVAVWDFIDFLRRRQGWVEVFINALYNADFWALGEEVQRVYDAVQVRKWPRGAFLQAVLDPWASKRRAWTLVPWGDVQSPQSFTYCLPCARKKQDRTGSCQWLLHLAQHLDLLAKLLLAQVLASIHLPDQEGGAGQGEVCRPFPCLYMSPSRVSLDGILWLLRCIQVGVGAAWRLPWQPGYDPVTCISVPVLQFVVPRNQVLGTLWLFSSHGRSLLFLLG